jgi:hypothetical protein
METESNRRVMPSEAMRACQLFSEMPANSYASVEVSGKLDTSLRHLNRLTMRKARTNSTSSQNGRRASLFYGGPFSPLITVSRF